LRCPRSPSNMGCDKQPSFAAASKVNNDRERIMGLLDGILGNVLGGMMGGGSGTSGNQYGNNPLGSVLGRLGGSGLATGALMALAFQLLQQNGGISGLVDKLRASGLGQHADSWVGTGANMPVSADQIREALSKGGLERLASKFGLSSDQASGGLAQLLPELVNQMTPAGQVPDNHHELISEGLAALTPKTNA
jgi:uncharacterized protein YidB (DUF937 family)